MGTPELRYLRILTPQDLLNSLALQKWLTLPKALYPDLAWKWHRTLKRAHTSQILPHSHSWLQDSFITRVKSQHNLAEYSGPVGVMRGAEGAAGQMVETWQEPEEDEWGWILRGLGEGMWSMKLDKGEFINMGMVSCGLIWQEPWEMVLTHC